MNLAKFLRTVILWNTCERLLPYIARLISTRLISTWKKVFMHAICFSCIWFDYVKSKKRNYFDSFTKYKFVTTPYALGSPSCPYSGNDTSLRAYHFWDINVSLFLFVSSIFYSSKTNHLDGYYPFVKQFMEKSVFALYISCMYVLVFS